MSRLIVKNIAKGVTPEKLREVFGAKGNVTDVQLKYSADGKFRHFGFVGFQKEEDALEALKDLDNTCIKGFQIKVEQCLPLGDPNKPRAWSKFSSDSSAYKKIHQQEEGEKQDDKKNKGEKKNSVVGDVMKKYENDPAFSDFLEARTKGKKIWSNDYIADDEQRQKGNKKNKSSTPETERSSGNDKNNDNDRNRDDDSGVDEKDSDDQNENAKVAKAAISDMEYLKMKTKLRKNLEDQKPIVAEDILPAKEIKKKKKKKRKMKAEYYILLLRGLNPDSKTNNIKQFFRPLKVCGVRFKGIRKRMAFVDFASEKEMKLALKKDKSFLDGCRISVKLHKQHSEKSQNSNIQWEAQSESLKNEESIGESGRLFVRNLPYTATETGLETLFSKYGPLSEVNMPIDNFSRKPKGFAIIIFLMPEHAVKAYMELDGSIFEGRMLHILPGKAKKTIEEMLEMEGLSYKQKKTLKMKAQATASINWNTLFLGQNAVADLIAKNYNTTKDKVLDARGKESLAVRLALGETEIVNETRKFLLEKGVHLNAFNQPTTQRSKTVILVKNLPAETTVSEVYELFAKFGELGRVLLPESGVTAIVEFLEPSEARGAFRKLAYSKFKDVPLYLEWAPENTFSTAFVRKTTPKLSKVDAVSKGDGTTIDQQHAEEEQIEVGRALSSVKEEEEESEEEEEEEEEAPEPDTTLFIKNLCFSTTEDAIKEHFQKCSPIHDVTIVRKKDPKNPGKFIPMGYGFIQFKRKDSLEKALKSYQNSVLDGFSLELKRSNRTLQSDVVAARKPTKIGKQTGSKILVRNVPFQATLQEVRELFKTFGEIKASRLPRKMAGTGSHRGFGFVEYYTRHDAKRALKALSQSTHLYGRRLVLEWANTDEDVDELRRKTAHLFNNIPSHYQHSKSTVEFNIEEMEH